MPKSINHSYDNWVLSFDNMDKVTMLTMYLFKKKFWQCVFHNDMNKGPRMYVEGGILQYPPIPEDSVLIFINFSTISYMFVWFDRFGVFSLQSLMSTF